MRLEPNSGFHVTEAGSGKVAFEAGVIHLTDHATPPGHYTNAQITDYTYADFALRWEPPVRLTVTAQATRPASELRGTAGFGFWNHSFPPGRLPRLPRAVWFFFGSPPGNLALAHGVAGHGWKAATIDAASPRAWALAPLALPVVVLSQFPALYDRLWPPIQRKLRLSERLLAPELLSEMHLYAIHWQLESVRFSVDGIVVHQTPFAPRGQAGFIAWIDNQYAIVTPQARFGWGTLPLEHDQGLIIKDIEIVKE